MNELVMFFFMKNLCMIFNSECTQVQDELDEMAKGLTIIATGLLERSLTQIFSQLFELFIF